MRNKGDLKQDTLECSAAGNHLRATTKDGLAIISKSSKSKRGLLAVISPAGGANKGQSLRLKEIVRCVTRAVHLIDVVHVVKPLLWFAVANSRRCLRRGKDD
jgi:hypothetical protein